MVRVKEEEIIKEVKTMFKDSDSKYWIGENGVKALQGLLDLYENKKQELERQINARMINEEFVENNYISKDKIRELFDLTINQFIEERYIGGEHLIVKVLKELRKELLEEE